MSVGCVVTAMLLAACGGGSAGGDAVQDDGRETAQGAMDGWVQCSRESQRCEFDGSQDVRYGSESAFVVRRLEGGTDCSNAVFGDPAVAQTKWCWLAAGPTSVAAASPASSTWEHCARESQSCDFTGTRLVRYGTETRYVTATFTDGVTCSNAVFGDPAYGEGKTCRMASPMAAATAPDAEAAVDVTTTWQQCAKESQTCTFSGTRQVRYGTPTTFVVRTFTGSVSCSNSVFGDPAVAQTKWCWYAQDASAQPAPSPAPAPAPDSNAGDWTRCASEGGQCNFTGTRSVRYGTVDRFVTKTLSGGTACTNVVFGDPAVGQGKFCRHGGPIVSSPEPDPLPTPVAPSTGPSGSRPPIVFNASRSARAGDIVSLQGSDFGSDARVLTASGQSLEVVNRVGDVWLAARVPAEMTAAIGVQVVSSGGSSGTVWLNRARPTHLDATQLMPSGMFRVFGQNLLLRGFTPRVTVAGRTATVDLAASREHMLVVRAPADLAAAGSVAIGVDNGNGSGVGTLERTIAVTTGGSGDPFGLGVGWGGAFAPTIQRVIAAATDARLGNRVVCDGRQDISRALQQAIDLAASSGGGIVRLPSGQCRLAALVSLRSNVVVEGAGKSATQLRYEANYPFMGQRLDRAGLRNLALVNAGPANEGLLLKDSRRVFLQNMLIDVGRSRQMFLSGNRDVVISGVDFVQRGSISSQGVFTLNNSAGLVFRGNTVVFVDGTQTFARVHEAWIDGNRFTRDASNQNSSGTIHTLAMDFAYRVAITDNTFDVRNGPIWNKTRNDGETLLTEGGGNVRTESLGSVVRSTANTVTVSGDIKSDAFGEGSIPENFGIALVAGKGAGQTRRVTARSGATLTVDSNWDVTPDSTTRYSAFVWGLEQSLIKGNRLSQNPRGIWLYHTGIRDVDVLDNDIREGGGIYLRSFQNLSQGLFMPIYNVRIAGNSVVNTTSQWSSYVSAVFVNADARAFGLANLGIEIRDNTMTANSPNVSSSYEEYVGTEGFVGMMRVENYAIYESMSMPRQLGTIFQRNQCSNCDTAFRIGTGAGGTVLSSNPRGSSTAFLEDWATTRTREKSTDTVLD